MRHEPPGNRRQLSTTPRSAAQWWGQWWGRCGAPRRWTLAVAVLLCAIAVCRLADTPARAQQSSANAELQTKARQAVLMDAQSGAILFQHKADEPAPPASMSKLMTLAVLFKAMKSGQVKPDDEFVMSENAWRKGGAPSGTSAMMVPVNTKARVDELIQGIIIQSGNDSAIAVAEGLAGSEEAFAKLMDTEARRIGLKGSTFRNATGLHDPAHLMTATDLATLSRFLIREYPEHYPVFAQKEFQYRKHRFINRNPLLFMGLNADGLKTGHTKEAGFGLVGSAVENDRRLIVVVGGLPTADDRKSEAKRLLEWGFKSFGEFKLFDAGETVGHARVWGGETMYVTLVGQGDVAVVLPRFPANQRLRAEIVYNSPLKAPVKKGDQIARLKVTSSSNAVNEVPLYAGADVADAGIMRKGIDSLLHLAFKWVPL